MSLISKKFDYSKFYPGLVLGTTDMSPIAMAIRATTAGIQNIFNPNISTHVLAVVKEHDLLYGIEMAPPRIREIDLNKYEHGPLLNHIVFAAHFIEWDDYKTQDKVNEWLLESHTKGIKYDIIELFKFWDDDIPDDPKKLICSDLIRNMMKFINIKIPIEWNKLCDPYDIQRYSTNNNKLIKWWK
jgi:hypothetical protein